MRNCPRDAHTRGWCELHYQRWRRTGSVTGQDVRLHHNSESTLTMRWQSEAACKGVGSEKFFPPGEETNHRRRSGPEYGEAKKFCARCPVIDECRDWAMRNEAYGFWGGTTPVQRRRARPLPWVPSLTGDLLRPRDW